MRPLTSADILQVWEQAAALAPLERALVMLGAACPERTRAELAEMDLGWRDAQLWRLRQLTFGSQLAAFTECPRCQERLEFTFDVSELGPFSAETPASLELTLASETLRFRLPTSVDLRAVASLGLESARRAVVRRCVLEPSGFELSEQWLLELTSRMEAYMHCSEVVLPLGCPACRHQWQSSLDAVAFVWAEINAQAPRVLREVHVLAAAYGWHEADILALSSLRRQAYLGMLSG